MRLTRFGIQGVAFHALVVVAFYATPYSNPFFLLLGFLTLAGLLGLLAARRNLRGVDAVLGEPEPVPSGLAPRASATLTAPPGRSRFGVVARLELEGGGRLSGRAPVLAGRCTVSLEGPPLPRGVHRVASAVLESTHPFGLVRVRRSLGPPGELVVYPAPSGSLEGRSATDALEELLGPGAPGAGDLQPASLRDHREGDGRRGIHWRASARRGRLVVQEWEGGRGHGLEVLLDRRCDADELEEALGLLSALVSLARTGKETLRLHSQGLSATFGEGQRPWREALRFLAAARRLPPDAPAPPPVSPAVVRLPRALART